MKITSVKAIPFRARRKNVWHAAFGTVAESEYAIVIIESDEGQRGVGEIATVWDRRGISQADDVNRLLAPLLVGADPLRCPSCAQYGCIGRSGAINQRRRVSISRFTTSPAASCIPVYQLLEASCAIECN
jgi:L-alanine-DL-glutamate epimerase-like enolase superfamily enzyme